MLESYKWMGWVWVWDGMGWKSLKGVILRAPLCGAKNAIPDSGVIGEINVAILLNFIWRSADLYHS